MCARPEVKVIVDSSIVQLVYVGVGAVQSTTPESRTEVWVFAQRMWGGVIRRELIRKNSGQSFSDLVGISVKD